MTGEQQLRADRWPDPFWLVETPARAAISILVVFPTGAVIPQLISTPYSIINWALLSIYSGAFVYTLTYLFLEEWATDHVRRFSLRRWIKCNRSGHDWFEVQYGDFEVDKFAQCNRCGKKVDGVWEAGASADGRRRYPEIEE